MPSSLEALAIVTAAVLPGGLYVWAFERQVGHWGVSFGDRVLRFIGASLLLHLVAAPATYRIWRDVLRDGFEPGATLPLWLWPVALLYAALPTLIGVVIGHGVKRRWSWAESVAGKTLPPTAWDYYFALEGNPWIRCRLRESDTWVGGAFEDGSYAGRHPEPGDLYLSQAAEVDPDTGEFVEDEHGNPVLRGTGLLVRWDEIIYLEIGREERRDGDVEETRVDREGRVPRGPEEGQADGPTP
ncbi:MAG TPA: DUF6338 family protein [Solirubrobacteraceae bacterium]|nr:DUF6338 family protein [Solirubrobacteraceae bacterium]